VYANTVGFVFLYWGWILKYYRNIENGYGTVFMVAWSGWSKVGWWGVGGVFSSRISILGLRIGEPLT